MALQKCNECSKDVSGKAQQCPNCGAPVIAEKPEPKRYGCLASLLIVVVPIVIVVVANNRANSPQGMTAANRRDAERQAKAQNDARLRSEAEVISVEDVVAYYSDNEVAGDAALKDKWFKVKGEVDRVGKDLLGTSYVVFRTNGTRSFRTVQCFFDDSHNARLASIQSGSRLVVFGRCGGLMVNVLMDKCEITTAGGGD